MNFGYMHVEWNRSPHQYSQSFFHLIPRDVKWLLKEVKTTLIADFLVLFTSKNIILLKRFSFVSDSAILIQF